MKTFLSIFGGACILAVTFLGGSGCYKKNKTYRDCYDVIYDNTEEKVKERNKS